MFSMRVFGLWLCSEHTRFRPAMLRGLSSRVWPEATLPDGADVSHVFCGKQKDTIVHRTLKV